MDSAGTDNSGVRIFPPAIFLGALLLSLLLQIIRPIALAPEAWAIPRIAVGVLLACAGLALLVSASSMFRRAGTPRNPTKPTTALTFSGPFRFTRNPMYLGMSVILVSAAFFANSWWPIIWLVPTVGFLQRNVIDLEERYLERKFGAEYTGYKSRVRRWL